MTLILTTWKAWLFILLITLINGCATMISTSTPSSSKTPADWQTRLNALSSIPYWQLKAKIAIIANNQANSAYVDWQQQKRNYTISLMGPLGMNSLTLKGSPGHVSLKNSSQQPFTAATPEKLIEKVWGLNFPVSNLYYWIRAIPAPDSSYQTRFNQNGQLTQLAQQGWLINYQNYLPANQYHLPTFLTLSHEQIKIKVSIYQWQVK
jgi:outer membrane lipoprotein LolB